MFKKMILCVTCSGVGKIAVWGETQKLEQCPFCKGSGRVWEIKTYEPYEPDVNLS